MVLLLLLMSNPAYYRRSCYGAAAVANAQPSLLFKELLWCC